MEPKWLHPGAVLGNGAMHQDNPGAVLENGAMYQEMAPEVEPFWPSASNIMQAKKSQASLLRNPKLATTAQEKVYERLCLCHT